MSGIACRKCGAEIERERPIIVNDNPKPTLSVAICDACFEEAIAGATALRKEFEALMSTGMSRQRAGAIMCDRVERRRHLVLV